MYLPFIHLLALIRIFIIKMYKPREYIHSFVVKQQLHINIVCIFQIHEKKKHCYSIPSNAPKTLYIG